METPLGVYDLSFEKKSVSGEQRSIYRKVVVLKSGTAAKL